MNGTFVAGASRKKLFLTTPAKEKMRNWRAWSFFSIYQQISFEITVFQYVRIAYYVHFPRTLPDAFFVSPFLCSRVSRGVINLSSEWFINNGKLGPLGESNQFCSATCEAFANKSRCVQGTRLSNIYGCNTSEMIWKKFDKSKRELKRRKSPFRVTRAETVQCEKQIFLFCIFANGERFRNREKKKSKSCKYTSRILDTKEFSVRINM